MATESTFVCPQCGKTHQGLPKDRAFKLPDDVWAIPEAERAQRAHWNSDLCQMGERYFIRCLLRVPFAGSKDEYFGWGIWVEVDRAAFYRYVEIYDADGSNEPAASGTLANAIPTYPDANRSSVMVRFGLVP